LQAGSEESVAAALDLITTFAQGDINPDMLAEYSPGGKTYSSIWERVVDAAERFNDLGKITAWTDPDFDPSQSAFYYARVLEIPTPRWVVYDAFRFGVDIPDGAETVHQERAYTTPIWFGGKD
jgi:hypothetical protein